MDTSLTSPKPWFIAVLSILAGLGVGSGTASADVLVSQLAGSPAAAAPFAVTSGQIVFRPRRDNVDTADGEQLAQVSSTNPFGLLAMVLVVPAGTTPMNTSNTSISSVVKAPVSTGSGVSVQTVSSGGESSGHVTGFQNAGEPASLVLAGIAWAAAGLEGWRRRRRLGRQAIAADA